MQAGVMRDANSLSKLLGVPCTTRSVIIQGNFMPILPGNGGGSEVCVGWRCPATVVIPSGCKSTHRLCISDDAMCMWVRDVT